MKKFPRNIVAPHVLLSFGFGILGLFLMGCPENPSSPSLYDPNYTGKPAPTLTGISPSTGALAGVTTITLTGSGFATSLADNYVFFDALQANLQQVTATQVVLTAPILPKDSIRVVVTVKGSAQFSNAILYKLDTAVTVFGSLATTEEPYGVTCDSSGNLFVSMTNSGSGVGTKKFTPLGVRSDYAPSAGVAAFSALKVGPTGILYGSRGPRALYQIDPVNGPSVWVGPASGVGSISDFDFDALGNAWGGGNDVAISRINKNKEVKLFTVNVGDVKSVRVYNGYLYAAATTGTSSDIWRFQLISADTSLGTAEKYFAFSTQYAASAVPFAITFSSDGYLYIGTDGLDGIILVRPDKTWEPYYPGQFKPQTLTFGWGKGSDLFLSRSGSAATHVIVKVNTQKSSAPYYGRQ